VFVDRSLIDSLPAIAAVFTIFINSDAFASDHGLGLLDRSVSAQHTILPAISPLNNRCESVDKYKELIGEVCNPFIKEVFL